MSEIKITLDKFGNIKTVDVNGVAGEKCIETTREFLEGLEDNKTIINSDDTEEMMLPCDEEETLYQNDY